MIKVGICDDHIELVNQITEKLKEFSNQEKILIEFKTYTSSEVLMADIKDNIYYDIFILDIELPKYSGLELACIIKNQFPAAIIIIVTSYQKYAVKAFEYSVFRYIPKNDLNLLSFAIKDSVALLNSQSADVYILKTPKRYQRILYREIVYVYKENKNSVFVLEQETVKIRQTLKVTYNELNSNDFIWIERGYIVNIVHITKIVNNMLCLSDGSSIYINNQYKKYVKDALSMYWRKMV